MIRSVQVNVERRLFSFRFGDPDARMNWVHVNNLVLAHLLAAEALTPKRSCVAVSHEQFHHNLFKYAQCDISLPTKRMLRFHIFYSFYLLTYFYMCYMPHVYSISLLCSMITWYFYNEPLCFADSMF